MILWAAEKLKIIKGKKMAGLAVIFFEIKKGPKFFFEPSWKIISKTFFRFLVLSREGHGKEKYQASLRDQVSR